MTKTTRIRNEETIVERYENPDFAPIIRETHKTVVVDDEGRETRSSSRRVYRDEKASHPDYCKALVLANARYGSLMELPYLITGISTASSIRERMCLICHVRWSEMPPPAVKPPPEHGLREQSCPNGHQGSVILTGAELPYTDPEQWQTWLWDDNPPGKVSFRRGKEGYPAFRDLVMPLDFRVFDRAKVDEIRAMYRSTSKTTVTVDAELIAQGELEEG